MVKLVTQNMDSNWCSVKPTLHITCASFKCTWLLDIPYCTIYCTIYQNLTETYFFCFWNLFLSSIWHLHEYMSLYFVLIHFPYPLDFFLPFGPFHWFFYCQIAPFHAFWCSSKIFLFPSLRPLPPHHCPCCIFKTHTHKYTILM